MKSILDFADTENEFDWDGWFNRCDEREELVGLNTFSVEYMEDGDEDKDIWWRVEIGLTEEEATLMRNYENENYLVQFLLKSTMCRLLETSEIVRLRLV